MSHDTEDRQPRSHPAAQARMEELAVEVALDPGGAAFPALADAYRRAGRVEDARRVAETGLRHAPERIEGRVALALSLLDLGEVEAGRNELTRVLAADPNALSSGALSWEPASPEVLEPEAPPVEPVAAVEATPVEATPIEVPAEAPPELPAVDDEIELAFEEAATDADAMVDATRVAQQAMRSGDLLEPEGTFTPALHPEFATETMADLLENQGDAAGAEQIRESLEQAAAPAPLAPRPAQRFAPGARRERIVRTLEGWLHNIRREVA